MRSREKLGLLLGLVSIIIIVYLIKGYSFVGQDKPNRSSEVINSTQNVIDTDPDLMDDARMAVKMINDQRVSIRKVSVSDYSPRSVTKLNGSRVSSRSASATYSTSAVAASTKRRSIPSYYTVKSGDSLGKIAKNVYGSKGNTYDNVERIYQANKKLLKSRDVVLEGQRLVIPSLETVTVAKKKQNFAQRIMSNITGRNHATSLSSASANYIEYRVKKGDSLYKIAKKYLGSGNRYEEIRELNKKQLAGSYDLEVGAILKLPRN